MEDKKEILKFWCPVTKDKSGEFVGILSDTSMDRDKEFMSKELLQNWATNTSLKALANHKNEMQSWVGGWSSLKTISKGRNTALVAKPWFFSKDANPLAEQVRLQVEESIKKGMGAGISIGAIPMEHEMKEIDGEEYKVYTKAELVEATWVPIQSNRNASFGHIAKQFELEMCHKSLEVKKMSEEEKAPAPEAEAAPVEEAPAVEEAPKEETPKEEVPAEEAKEEVAEEAKSVIAELKKEIEKLKKHAVNTGSYEKPVEKKVDFSEIKPTFENVVKATMGVLGK